MIQGFITALSGSQYKPPALPEVADFLLGENLMKFKYLNYSELIKDAENRGVKNSDEQANFVKEYILNAHYDQVRILDFLGAEKLIESQLITNKC